MKLLLPLLYGPNKMLKTRELFSYKNIGKTLLMADTRRKRNSFPLFGISRNYVSEVIQIREDHVIFFALVVYSARPITAR